MAAPVRIERMSGIYAFTLIICSLISTISGQTSQGVLVPSTVDLNSICSCDLTFNKCDINCCCDNECTANDTQAFSRCDDYFGVDNSESCIQKKMIFINNSPFVVNEDSVNTLFCVYTDNYLQRNTYYQPQTVNTSLLFNMYMNRHDIGIWNVSKNPYAHNMTEGATYRSRDAVLTLFDSSDAIGLLGLPRAVNNGNCLDANPAGYLQDESSTCIRQLAPLSTSCQTTPELNAETFYKSFKLFDQPGYPTGNVSLANVTAVTPVLPARCVDLNNFEADCDLTTAVPTPEYNATSAVCKYALSELEYRITYDPDKQGAISSAEVNFKLRELKAADLPLVQTYKVRWIRLNANLTSPAKSGNPGYLVDKPLLAGKRVQRTVDGVTRVAISMNTDPDTWLTMLTSSKSGDCQQNENSRSPIKFGINMRSGCTVNVDINNLTTSCQILQDYAKSLLLSQSPAQYVGRYGNTDLETFGDWVQILTENDPPAAQGSTSQKGVCFNMVLGMHYQVLYAKTGLLSNPQNMIIGVMRRFQQPQVLRFNCMGEYCQPTTLTLTQKVEITSSVSFIDVSQPAVPVEKSRPVLAVRLPYDFFYPFLSGKATSIGQSLSVIMISVILAVVMVIK